MNNLYKYYVNLDERGEFFADLRTPNDDSLWEADTQAMTELIEGGFMQHKTDIASLCFHLIDCGVLPKQSKIVMGD